jgi:signal transduction histidine kinase
MRRRSKASGPPAKPRRRKPAPKRRGAAKPVRRRSPPAAKRETEVARLRRELNEAVEQQHATTEMLRLINSAGDPELVFTSILASALRLCEADNGAIHRWDGEALHLIATQGMPEAYIALRKRTPHRPRQVSASARMLASKAPVHIDDLAADRAYLEGNPPTVAAVELAGVRTTLAVPMLKDNELIGSFTVGRCQVRPFSAKQIAIVQNFAAQAVTAVENARLLGELRERTEELGRSVAALQQERNNKLMNLEAMAASIAHEVRQPLASIASNGGAALRFLGHTPPNLEEMQSALGSIIRDSHRASQVFENIRALFGKADQRQEPLDVNELALGVLRTLRDELKDNAITTHAALNSELPPIMGHKGQLQEVLVNLIRNAIDAMETGIDAGQDDRRVLQVRAERHGDDAVVVAVEDSGPGIDPKQLDSIFDAFMTTKPNGMGLGLAICRMIVERHAGRLVALPAKPRGSVFQIVLPAGAPAGAG